MDWLTNNVLPMVVALTPYGGFFGLVAYYGFRSWKNKTAEFPKEIKTLQVDFEKFGKKIKDDLRSDFHTRISNFEKRNEEHIKAIADYQEKTEKLLNTVDTLTTSVNILLDVVAILVGQDKEMVKDGKAKTAITLINDFKAKKLASLTEDENLLKLFLSLPKEKIEALLNEESKEEEL